jgi:hypothetical protein
MANVQRSYAAEIQDIFERLEVPLEVRETPDLGKHVVAKKDLPRGTTLLQEIPLVSWPLDAVTLQHPSRHCWYCLRWLRPTEEGLTHCQNDSCTAVFCAGCSHQAREWFHQAICGDVENALRTFHRAELLRINLRESDGVIGLPITVESVGRSIATIVARMASVIISQRITAQELLQEPTITGQLFSAATKPFNRLVEPPQGTEFEEIDVRAWHVAVRGAMEKRIEEVLVGAVIHVAKAQQAPELTALQHAREEPTDQHSMVSCIRPLVAGVLSLNTVNTIIGQLSINSQAILGLVPQICIIGGAVFTLQSNFNHSCDPNTEVDNTETHEIRVKTCRDVARGDELTIAYIPVEGLSWSQRREKLRAYFFECDCSRCRRECAEQSRDASGLEHPPDSLKQFL